MIGDYAVFFSQSLMFNDNQAVLKLLFNLIALLIALQ